MLSWYRDAISCKKGFCNTNLMKKHNKCDRNFCTTQRKSVTKIRRNENFSALRSNANVTPQGNVSPHSCSTSTEIIPGSLHYITDYLQLIRNFYIQLQNLSSTYTIGRNFWNGSNTLQYMCSLCVPLGRSITATFFIHKCCAQCWSININFKVPDALLLK